VPAEEDSRVNRHLIAAAALALPLIAAAAVFAACGTSQGASSAGAMPSVPAEETATAADPMMPTTTASVTEPIPPTPESELEDGRHFGYIKSVDLDPQPATLTFDLAYPLAGEEANREAERRGNETPVPNDYFIVNDNPNLRTLPLSDELELRLLDWNHCCATFFAGDFKVFAATFDREHPPVGSKYRGPSSAYELMVRDGVVVAVDERYFP
jgi:hypothetical protein